MSGPNRKVFSPQSGFLFSSTMSGRIDGGKINYKIHVFIGPKFIPYDNNNIPQPPMAEICSGDETAAGLTYALIISNVRWASLKHKQYGALLMLLPYILCSLFTYILCLISTHPALGPGLTMAASSYRHRVNLVTTVYYVRFFPQVAMATSLPTPD